VASGARGVAVNVLAIYAAFLRAFFPRAGWLSPWAWPLVVLGIGLFVGAYSLAHVIRRRRFNRRNFAGVEQFRSYGHKLVTEFQEFGIALIGALLMLASFFVFGAALVGFAFR
jgi:hypothetical protein